MQLSIIIINFNTPLLTIQCMNSIKEYCRDLAYEIILVDNAPKSDDKHSFISCNPELIYVLIRENIGFGKANNEGMKIAKGKYLLLLNSDTLLLDDSLKKAVQFMDNDTDEKIGLLGCKLLNEDLSYQHSYYPYKKNSLWDYFKANNPLLNRVCNIQKDFSETNEIIEVGDVSGAFMLLRRTVFESVKGFDPDFFLYCEETEWCRNRIVKQYKLIYYPETKIIHLGGKSAPKEQMQIQSAISEYLFWYKCGIIFYCSFFIINFVNFLTNVVLYPFLNSANKEIVKHYLKRYVIALKYALLDVPRYSKSFGSRKEPLIYEGARSIFFEPTSKHAL